jgi:hypothetical protein
MASLYHNYNTQLARIRDSLNSYIAFLSENQNALSNHSTMIKLRSKEIAIAKENFRIMVATNVYPELHDECKDILAEIDILISQSKQKFTGNYPEDLIDDVSIALPDCRPS